MGLQTLEQAVSLAEAKASRKLADHCVMRWNQFEKAFTAVALKSIRGPQKKYIVLTVHADGSKTENPDCYWNFLDSAAITKATTQPTHPTRKGDL